MVYHPRDPAHRSVSRRDFLRRSLAAGVALPTASAILAACGSDSTDGTNADTGEDLVPRFGTAENRYISTLYGAMMVEWSVNCRPNPRRTRPRKCTARTEPTRA